MGVLVLSLEMMPVSCWSSSKSRAWAVVGDSGREEAFSWFLNELEVVAKARSY